MTIVGQYLTEICYKYYSALSDLSNMEMIHCHLTEFFRTVYRFFANILQTFLKRLDEFFHSNDRALSTQLQQSVKIT